MSFWRPSEKGCGDRAAKARLDALKDLLASRGVDAEAVVARLLRGEPAATPSPPKKGEETLAEAVAAEGQRAPGGPSGAAEEFVIGTPQSAELTELRKRVERAESNWQR